MPHFPDNEPKTPNTLRELHDPQGRVLVAAHRGCWHSAPENSLLSLQACKDLSVDIIEIDLRQTADGEVVVFHDKSLKRMTGHPSKVSELTLADLKKFRLRNRDGRGEASLTSYQIPTFSEYLRANNRETLLILDLKSEALPLARAAAKILKNSGNCDITMFAFVASAENVHEQVGPLLGCSSYIPNLRVPMGNLSVVAISYKEFNPIAVAVRFDDWDYLKEGRQSVKDMNIRLWVNTLSKHHAGGLTDQDALTDPDLLWGRLIDEGVSMIQTDEPEALVDYLKFRNRNSND